MYVYVISAGERRHKIGIATNPVDRLNTMQTGSCDKLRLAHLVEVPNAREVERRAHELMAAARIHGEWFDVSESAAKGMVGVAISHFNDPDLIWGSINGWTHAMGDRVQCRKSGRPWLEHPLPVEGLLYTISHVYEDGSVDVAEVENDDVSFCASMFWPAGVIPALASEPHE